MHFTKMHGAGNDYLYVFGAVPENIAEISRKLSDRHFGAGSDGMIYISPSTTADFEMRIFNADGSEAKMCGNGIRCVGKYVYDKGYTDKTQLNIQTLSGIKKLHLQTAFGSVQSVGVEMGKAFIEQVKTLEIGGKSMQITKVNIGNPHAVIIADEVSEQAVTAIGKPLQEHPEFPDGVNVECITLQATNSLRMKVWERGSGITLACGTGACASAVAAVYHKLCSPKTSVEVQVDGGKLYIDVSEENDIYMRGPAAFIYEGETNLF